MVGIVAGNSLGLSSTSLGSLNGGVQDPSAAVGRGKDYAYVNAVTGNLVIQRNDDLSVALGNDTAVLRTYNSQGLLDDENADNWRIGFYRSVKLLAGVANTAGSSVVRVDADGSEALYRYDTARGVYVTKDGAGADDYLELNTGANLWTWRDGASSTAETYSWDGVAGRLESENDGENNYSTYSYTGNLLTSIANASGDTTILEYSGSNLVRVKSIYANGQESVLVRYQYDLADRLSQVIVDLTPEDASIADGATYTTSYTYDGDSQRISSVIQKDGSALYISYELIAGKQRVVQATQIVNGSPRTTSYSYATTTADSVALPSYSVSAIPSALTVMELSGPTILLSPADTWEWAVQTIYGIDDPLHIAAAIAALKVALGIQEMPSSPEQFLIPETLNYSVDVPVNSAALEDVLPEPTLWDLNSGALQNSILEDRTGYLTPGAITGPGWAAASPLESLTQAASAPQFKYDELGNAHAAWVQNNNIYYQKYSSQTGTWASPVVMDGSLSGAPSKLTLDASANGNVILAWVQGSNIYARRNIAGSWDTPNNAIPLLENATGAATNPVAAITNDGLSVVVFSQTDGTQYNLYATLNQGAGWQSSPVAIDDVGTVNNNDIGTALVPSIAIDSLANVSVAWRQKFGTQTANSLFYTQYNSTTGTWGSSTSTIFENSTTAVSQSQIVFDLEGNGLAMWLQGSSLLSKTLTSATGLWSSAITLSTTATGVPSLSMSRNGNAIAAWTESGNVFARVYSSKTWSPEGKVLLESESGVARNPAAAINNAGQAVVGFVQSDGSTNNVLAARFNGGAWLGAVLIEDIYNSLGTAASDTPAIGIDDNGNIQAIWLQKNSSDTVNSIIGTRFDSSSTPYYIVPAGATWESLANVLYGTPSAADALKTFLNDIPLTVGTRITGIPDVLAYTEQVAVSPHYVVSPGATWAEIALALYGSESAADQLRQAMGDVDISEGTVLYGMPSVITLQPPSVKGILVAEGATWASIATSLYGNADYADALAAAMGNPGLTVGSSLVGLPTNLSVNIHKAFSNSIEHVVAAGQGWAEILLSVYGSDDPLAASQLQNFLNDIPLVEGAVINLPLSVIVYEGPEKYHTLNARNAVSGSTYKTPYYRLKGVSRGSN